MTAGRQVNSQNREWGTPEKYVKPVQAFFGGGVSLDPCSNEWSIVGAKKEYCLPAHDGLRESWDYPTIYVNPPYGKDKQRGTSIRDWLARCAMAHADHRSRVLALVPVASNTRHWKDSVFGKAAAICFLADTRLPFLVDGRPGGRGAPMSCAIVYWGNAYRRFLRAFSPFGAVVDLRPFREARA